MPRPTSLCQRCQTRVWWSVEDGRTVATELHGELHRCPVEMPWGVARSVEHPQLIAPVTRGFVIGIDLETTGIPGRIDNPEIIELAATLLRLEDGQIVDQFSQLIKPRGPLLAVEVHKITADMLEHEPHLEEGIARFKAWRERVQRTWSEQPIPLVSHNAAFELSFLEPCEVAGPWICTLVLSQTATAARAVKGFHSLGNIVERMGLAYDGEAHRALPDARICAQVYWMMTAQARAWDDLCELSLVTLGEARADLAERTPVTAGLLLYVQQQMGARIRRFQDRSGGEGPREGRSEHLCPWSPPPMEDPWPYMVYDPVVFEPLPRMLEVVRRVYRAERMGLDLEGLADQRARPTYQEVAPRPAPRIQEPTAPSRAAPSRPDLSGARPPPRPPPPEPRGEAPTRAAPHKPTFGAKGP